ncbi:hypothetical protein EON66_10115, partial [archaeon]
MMGVRERDGLSVRWGAVKLVAAVVLVATLALSTFVVTFVTSSVQPVGLRPSYTIDADDMHAQPHTREPRQRGGGSFKAGDEVTVMKQTKSGKLRAWRSDGNMSSSGMQDASSDPWAKELQRAGVASASGVPERSGNGQALNAPQADTIKERQQRARAPALTVPTQYAPHNGTVAVPFMLVGVPTVHRANSPDYLRGTLDFLSAQIVEDTLSTPGDSNIMGPYPMRVHVMIVNNMRPPEQHVSWMAERDAACGAFGAAAAPPRSVSKVGRCAVYHAQDFTVFSTPLSPFTFVVNKKPVVEDGSDAGDPNRPG